MNLLSYLVPAVREIRAPLIGGYLWLLAAWLAVADRVPLLSDGATGSVWAHLDRVRDALGTGGGVAALSVAAYLVGSLLGEPITIMFRTLGWRDERLEFLGAAAPESKHAIDVAMRLRAEAELRFQVAVPVAAIGAVVAWEHAPVWGIALTVLAVLFAAHGFGLAHRAAKTARVAYQVAERHKDDDAEEERADVRARIERAGKERALVLTNAGPAVARGVDVIARDGETPRFVPAGLLPVAEIQPDDHAMVPLAVSMGDPVEVEVLVQWLDGTGRREREQTLRLV